MHILIASIENQPYAFDLSLVQRTLLAVALTPLPNAPPYILGAVNYHGDAIPVINLRQLFQLPDKKMNINDHLIICSGDPHPIAIWVDHIIQVKVIDKSDLTPAEQVSTSLPYIQSIVQKQEPMTLLINLNQIVTHAIRAQTHVA